ncbi:MAG: hypothetical protein QOG63_3115 [Thermoleophilaceae bacterium]|jgi:hypothetical protein|nr:hypothetical protein [Thermoleophilaceae bacterium]
MRGGDHGRYAWAALALVAAAPVVAVFAFGALVTGALVLSVGLVRAAAGWARGVPPVGASRPPAHGRHPSRRQRRLAPVHAGGEGTT